MNPGGEPERDDTGLPPVDIEIPDDARELDRDVQAYYRELRAERREHRRRRFHGFLAKDGIVLPLLACCLILALITGTLLTVFTATSDQTLPGLPGKAKAGAGASSAPSAAATSAQSVKAAPRPLPDVTLELAAGKSVRVRSLSGVMLLLVPVGCNCAAAAAQLARLAANQQARTYLVGSDSSAYAEAEDLAALLSTQLRTRTTAAEDPTDALRSAFGLHGLAAILVSPDGSVRDASDLPTAGTPSSELIAGLSQALTG